MPSARLLAGVPVAGRIEEELKGRLAARAARGLPPACLAIVWVGDDPASAAYIRGKRRVAARLGIQARLERLPAETDADAIAERVRSLSADDGVDGILVQAPLPDGVEYEAIVAEMDPRKDVDGFHPLNAGRLFRGRPGLAPCTARGVLALLDFYGIPVAGRRAVVLGRSNIVGRPTAALLEQADATVTVCHSRTPHVASIAREAEILVVAVGRPALVTADFVKPGAAVVDVGIHRIDGALRGDVAPGVEHVAGWLSPVPGGVGPLTVAMLMTNLVAAAEARTPVGP